LKFELQNVPSEMWQQACKKRGSLGFKIVSGSMSPIIEAGNVVNVTSTDPSGVCVGDIVALVDGQKVIVHRVIGKTRSNQMLYFRHRGDSGTLSGEIPAQNLVGKVTLIKKKGHEIRLDSRRHIISNIILGWRLRLVDTLERMHPRLLGIILHQALVPPWKLCRYLMLRRL
jgi:signal peptidase I